MIDSTKRWYAIYTKSRAEKKVAEQLEKTGIEVYLPLQKTMKQWSDRRKFVYEPLFRSYVFVRVDNSDYIDALSVTGAVCYVTIAKEKVPIPDNQIEAIKTYMGEKSDEEIIEYFESGDSVEIAFGSMKGLRGTLSSAKDHRKLIVQIDAINQNITITLASHLLMKVKA